MSKEIRQVGMVLCVCMTSEEAFALFHVDNCPHLNRTPTIGSNWHVASAVLGEIWGCTWPQTGCPFHQLECRLPVGGGGRGRSTSLLPCLLIKMMCADPLFLPTRLSLLPLSPASLSPSRYYRSRVFSHGPQPAADSFAVAVSVTFTWEMLWQAFHWKGSMLLVS